MKHFAKAVKAFKVFVFMVFHVQNGKIKTSAKLMKVPQQMSDKDMVKIKIK